MYFIRSAGQFNAATFAASAGMDLRLNDPWVVTQAFVAFTGAGAVVAAVSIGDQYSKISENRFCLVLVDIHVDSFVLNLVLQYCLTLINMDK